jgi:hypothetical protein
LIASTTHQTLYIMSGYPIQYKVIMS